MNLCSDTGVVSTPPSPLNVAPGRAVSSGDCTVAAKRRILKFPRGQETHSRNGLFVGFAVTYVSSTPMGIVGNELRNNLTKVLLSTVYIYIYIYIYIYTHM